MKEGINPGEPSNTIQHDLLQTSQFTIESWTPEIAGEIYEKLEHPNWAPWLEASQETIAGRAAVFPEGQLLLKENGVPVASLSMNKIHWDGNSDHLPSWDQVAGKDKTDYSETYQPDGNTLVLMSMNVADDAKGKQLPAKLIAYVKQLALDMGVEHVIGSFRPSGYGKAKKDHDYSLPFWDYCQMKVPGTDKPLDPWLRSLWWVGMQMIKPDKSAMEVTVNADDFYNYQNNYHPDVWEKVYTTHTRNGRNIVDFWECDEVGYWVIWNQDKKALYKESNVWGEIPFK